LPPLVSIVIANHNGGDLVERCLRSVLRTSFASFEVIVVDNASSDGSPESIVSRFPKVKLIRLSRNLGYATANNIGIREANGKYLVLLNSDTEVEPEWLINLLEVAERRPDAAFLQAKILFLDRPTVINSAGNYIHFAGFGVCRGIGTPDRRQYDQIREIGYASGACVMASREALRKIGLLDEIFFAYGEDKDWGWRAKMLGYRSLFVPIARVYHKWSAVLGWSPKKMYLLELERLVSIWKNHSTRLLIMLVPLLLLVESAVLAHSIIKGWWTFKILAYAHALSLRHEISKRRKELTLRRKIPDSQLIREFVYEIKHPYVGRLAIPLNRLCKLYARLLSAEAVS